MIVSGPIVTPASMYVLSALTIVTPLSRSCALDALLHDRIDLSQLLAGVDADHVVGRDRLNGDDLLPALRRMPKISVR